MSHENVPTQSITIDHPDTVAVFVDATDDRPTRVFYDLDALLGIYIGHLAQRAAVAQAIQDPVALAEVRGAASVLDGLRQSRDTLRLEREFAHGLADDPFGFTGEDGTLS